MTIDASVTISIFAVIVAGFSWVEARRLRKLTEISLKRQSYQKVATLPAIEPLKVVEVDGKHRAQLIIFNLSGLPLLVNCVRCFRYDPKRRTFSNWLQRKRDGFDRSYSQLPAFWNPKGHFDDDEYYAEETLPFTQVNEKEILLVTLSEYLAFPSTQYKFEVTTSQGNAYWEGTLPRGKSHLAHEHRRKIY